MASLTSFLFMLLQARLIDLNLPIKIAEGEYWPIVTSPAAPVPVAPASIWRSRASANRANKHRLSSASVAGRRILMPPPPGRGKISNWDPLFFHLHCLQRVSRDNRHFRDYPNRTYRADMPKSTRMVFSRSQTVDPNQWPRRRGVPCFLLPYRMGGRHA
jgi:hypothetical protein